MQKVKSQVNEVIGVMHQNIEKVLDRGAKLDDIEDRTGTFSFFFVRGSCPQFSILLD